MITTTTRVATFVALGLLFAGGGLAAQSALMQLGLTETVAPRDVDERRLTDVLDVTSGRMAEFTGCAEIARSISQAHPQATNIMRPTITVDRARRATTGSETDCSRLRRSPVESTDAQLPTS